MVFSESINPNNTFSFVSCSSSEFIFMLHNSSSVFPSIGVPAAEVLGLGLGVLNIPLLSGMERSTTLGLNALLVVVTK